MIITVAAAFLTFGCGSSAKDQHTGAHQSSQDSVDGGTVREYWIAAERVEWDYAPAGNLAGEPFDRHAGTFLDQVRYDPSDGDSTTDQLEEARIGSTYDKVLYREYTENFGSRKDRPDEWEHLGALGPVIHAEVGDTIKVHFKNKLDPSKLAPNVFEQGEPALSVHPHGVFYNKANEGAPYPDGTGETKHHEETGEATDGLVGPGQTYTYTWEVPKRAGPGPNDPDSIMWMYHSHTDETRDTYTGLIGPMIVTRKGRAEPDGTPKDVDRELITMFHVFDENLSLLHEHNIQKYTGVDPTRSDIADLTENEGFIESNLMHAINGLLYANLNKGIGAPSGGLSNGSGDGVPHEPTPEDDVGLTTERDEDVRWYVMGMGTEIDVHTPHWHGATVLSQGRRTDVVDVFPADMYTIDMQPDAAGEWLYHCHVNDHLDAGMIATFDVAAPTME